jgi:hypothetical protein
VAEHLPVRPLPGHQQLPDYSELLLLLLLLLKLLVAT